MATRGSRRTVGQPSPKLVITLSPELTARVLRFHAEAGGLGRPQDSARELIQLALDYPEVEASLYASARQLGFLSVRREVQDFHAVQLAELDAQWNRIRAESQAGMGVGDGQRQEPTG